ncbi:MAG TPA: universal stress protein [Hyphomicrobiaceae bacterium]|jgi:nucleotide-binding universal stress UspA family protein
MIAWDAGREATRAVHDALPILVCAEVVHVPCVNPRATMTGHGAQPGADIALHLSRHGIHTEVEHMQVHDLAPEEAILARVSDLGIELLVASAYGRSADARVAAGGMTRHLLRSTTVPVLMAH